MVDVLGPASTNAVTERPARTIIRGSVNTWFNDCTTPDSDDGTTLPSDFFNDVLAQLRTAFTQSGITVDNEDDMLWRAIQSRGLRYGVDTGGANNVVANFTPAVTSLYPGLFVIVKIAADNSGPATLAADATAAKPIRYGDLTALAAGALRGGMLAICMYDGSVYQYVAQLPTSAQSRYQAGQLVMALGSTALGQTVKGNGSIYNRADYPALWAYAQASGRIVSDAVWLVGVANRTMFSSGDGVNTFRVPDFRGEFLRAFDDGRGIDVGRVLGVWQDSLIKTHDHPGSSFAGTGTGTGSGTISGTASGNVSLPYAPSTTMGGDTNQVPTIVPQSPGTTDYPVNLAVGGTCNVTTVNVNVAGDVTVGAFGGAETRPRNAAVTICIAF